jgi:cellulose biosynthesis protein BcsQ
MTAGHPLPAPGHLYTWVDVDEHFAKLAARGEWEPWLHEVSAYWDGVEFTVARDTDPGRVWAWLAARLGPLTVDPEHGTLVLESLVDGENVLPVRLIGADEPPPVVRTPRWNERRTVRDLAESLPAPRQSEFRDGAVRVCAFHSFKGGVGRTLHCVALARELAERGRAAADDRGRVLLVDADLEAPGISWMITAQGGKLDFALDDFLALLQGALTSKERTRAVALARKFLLNQEHDGVIVLPTTRDTARVGPPRIQPADLITGDRSPYVLTEALADLAHELGADTVIVDLRAGSSELSAPVLLDPRVHRVFVTTISDQSVQGTVNLLNHLAHRAPSQRENDPVCSVLITQFQARDHDTELAEAAAELREAAARTRYVSPAVGEDADSPTDGDVASEPLTSPFLTPLLALPRSWGDVGDRIDRAGLRAVVSELADALRPPVTHVVPVDAVPDDIQTRRAELAELARTLVYADAADSAQTQGDFLTTESLLNLISTHRTEAPIEVVVGAKGSGKTFTYLRMCRCRTWNDFGETAGVSGIELRAPLVPVLASSNLVASLSDQVEAVRVASAGALTAAEPAPFLTIRDLVIESLGRDLNDIEWRRVWLACLARAAGLTDTAPDEAEGRLTELARNRQAVFVIDGLEDLFQDFSTSPPQQRALRALLTGCPEWLRSLRGRPLGLVVFVRRDLVLAAVQQNAPQFLERQRAYELRWSRTEALRLVAWVCLQARAVERRGLDVRSATADELSELLVSVWGQKLGSDRSREPRSEGWFFAALSDFNLQIQARDIVSFLSQAARGSIGDTRWTGRLLAPTAMRRALPQCSIEKIDAITQENPPVGKLFTHLRQLPENVRKVPFSLEAAGLDLQQARLLVTNGVLFQENDQYWMPEIYRFGLNFTPSGNGRPRVVSITKLVRSRAESG